MPLYRAPHDTFISTIERLERELRELRALRAPPRPRESLLWFITAVSVVSALLSFTVAYAIRTRAERAEHRYGVATSRLDRKTQDLETCEALAFHALRVDKD